MKETLSKVKNDPIPEEDKESLISKDHYLINLEELVSIVQEGEKRTFSEEIDKLEAYGGLFVS